MASVQVFVDDVVLGQLPPVCAKTGAPSSGRYVMDAQVGNSAGWAWLLVFAGPLGWLALLWLLTRTGESIRGEIPMSDAAYETIRARKRIRNGCLAVAALCLLGVFALPGGVAAMLILTLVALVTAIGFTIAADLASVDMDLDGSRRWVTLRRVHPDFVAAVRARRIAAPRD